MARDGLLPTHTPRQRADVFVGKLAKERGFLYFLPQGEERTEFVGGIKRGDRFDIECFFWICVLSEEG
jgi:hypothetical protein